MAIVPKPKKEPADARGMQGDAALHVEQAAAAFIGGALPTPAPVAVAAKKAKKEPVLLRFDDETLRKIDLDARRLGLSRAAWVRMVVAERLGEE